MTIVNKNISDSKPSKLQASNMTSYTTGNYGKFFAEKSDEIVSKTS